MVRLLTLLVALPFVGGGSSASAQRSPSSGSTPALGILLSHSTSSRSPVGRAVALTTVEVEWTLPISHGGWWGLEYAAAAAAAAVQENPRGVIEASAHEWIVWDPPPTATTFGFGLRGTGMRAWVGGQALRLHAGVAGGFLYFGTPLLAANAARFNFTGAAGVGVRVSAGELGYVSVGYRLQHLSNGGLGRVNPGMDAHQVYLGAWVR